MNSKEYIQQKLEFNDILIKYLQDDDSNELDYKELIQKISIQKYNENREEFKLFLHLIVVLSKNYRRSNTFFDKISKIFQSISSDIKQTFSNLEIFDIFSESKLILFILLQNKLLTFDKSIVSTILRNLKFINYNYLHYFYPEIKPLLNTQIKNVIKSNLSSINLDDIDDFNKKRQIGENDSYLCQIIRNDSIEEFVSYISKTNLSISSYISPSIFETNSFLLKNDNKITLIEYASFFASFQIINYLKNNNVPLTDSL